MASDYDGGQWQPPGGHVPPDGPFSAPGPAPPQYGAPAPAPHFDHVTPYDYGAPAPSSPPRSSGVAIAALIAGFVSICVPYLGGLVAIVLGIIALVQIKRSNGTKTGFAMAGVGIGLGVLTLAGWTVLITSNDFQEGFREGFEEGAQESATSSILEVGQCLNMSTADSDNFAVSATDVVLCSEPHTGEYAGSTPLPHGDGAEYPGEQEVFNEGLEKCLGIFLDYTGTEYANRPELDILVGYPESLRWRLFNDREVDCFVIDIDGGSRTGSVRG